MMPNSSSRPPERAMWIPSLRTGSIPVHSITASAPRPPVASRTFRIASSPPGNARSAPSCSASSRFSELRVIPITVAPRALASCTWSWPVTPSPSTATVSPGKILICRCACRHVVNTWIKGAVWLSIDSGRANTWLAGAVTYSANPPLASRPSSMPFGQRCVCPIRQWKQAPQ